jgi:membrane-associated phospholipid phosphatase
MRSGRDIAKVFETISIYLTVLGVSLLASEPTKWYVSWQRPNFFQVCEPDEATYTTCTGEDNYILAVYSFPSGHALTAFSGLTVFTCYLHFHYGVPAYMRQLRRARWEQALNNIVKDNKQGDNDDNDPAIVEIADEDDDNNNNNNNSKPKATTTITVDPGTLAWYRLRSMLAFVIPQGLALFVSVSRIKDNRHFPADVLAGALIGSVSALFITSLWWFETE